MSSERLLPILLSALLGALSISACGRKESPQPPPSKIPAPVNDLSVQQRGQELLLTMTYPSVTLGGLPIESVEVIEIYQMSRILSSLAESEEAIPAEETSEETVLEEGEGEEQEPEIATEETPAETEEPQTGLFRLPEVVSEAEEEASKEAMITVSGKDFLGLAELAWSIQGSELDSAVFGDQLVLRLPLAKPADESAEAVLIFGARTIAKGNRRSSFSNLVKILPRTAPAAPEGLTVEATPQGVQLDWEPVDEALGYRVYRRNANIRDYGEPLATVGEETLGYLDRSAEFGRRYIFTVTSIGQRTPLVESAIAAEHEVDYRDRFQPEPPRELVALAETGRVRLLWEASTSEDTRGYWIYRQDPGEPFAAINEDLVLGSEYLDGDLASGSLYRYYIIAVDDRDNQSEPSEEIEVRVP